MCRSNSRNTDINTHHDLSTAHTPRTQSDMEETTNKLTQSMIVHYSTTPENKFVQQVVGSFLYYARAVDPTILMALSDIATQQNKPTENTKKRVEQLLDYMATHPMTKIRFRASDMILNIHSDASYLSAPRHEAERVDISSLAAPPPTVTQFNSTAPCTSHARY